MLSRIDRESDMPFLLANMVDPVTPVTTCEIARTRKVSVSDQCSKDEVGGVHRTILHEQMSFRATLSRWMTV
jgi:hypothetical protein